jgi:hypothetical protein
LELLSAATPQYRPGVILKPAGSGEIRAAVWALLKENVTDPLWQTERSEALLAEREFQEKKGSGLVVKVPGLLSITLKDERDLTASFSVEQVEAEFLINAFESDLQERLRERFHDSPTWVKFIDDHRVVTECWYMRQLRVTFSQGGSQLAQAEVEARANISVAGSHEWQANETLSLSGSGKVPFAVRTFRP